MKRTILLIILLVVLTSNVFAEINPAEFEKMIEFKLQQQKDEILQGIDKEGDECRVDTANWITGYVKDVEKDARRIFWADRILTFFLVFFAVFLAESFVRLKERRYQEKVRVIENGN